MDYIKVKGLSKSYSDIKALKNLSIEIEAGTLFGILGPNGAGKSTLIKILATLIEPDSGEVFINNINLIKNSRKIRELIGYVAQDIALDKILTGRELLDFQSDLYHINKNKKYERINKLINELKKSPDDLSRAKSLFRWSILYMFGICLLLLISRTQLSVEFEQQTMQIFLSILSLLSN